MSLTKKTSYSEAILGALPNALITFDTSYELLYANNAAKALLHTNTKYPKVKSLEKIFEPTSPILDAIKKVVSTGHAITLYDATVFGKPSYTTAIFPIEDTHGGYVLSIQMAPELIKKDISNVSHVSIAQMLAHEIKNPLAGIQAAAQLLNKPHAEAEDKELLDLIAKEAERILRLVKNIDFLEDSIPEQRFRSLNIHEVLERVTQYSRVTFGNSIQIEENYDPSLPDMDGDFDSLLQAFMNLVKNAAESVKEDGAGRIVLRTRYDHIAPYHDVHMKKMPLRIEVEDNGCGVEPQHIQKIFTPRFSTKSGGEGLGLPIVVRIVENHGGFIDVSSKNGKTVFCINLPVSKQNSQENQRRKYA